MMISPCTMISPEHRRPRPRREPAASMAGARAGRREHAMTQEAEGPFVLLPGSEREPLPGIQPAGPLEDSERIEVTLVTRRRAPLPGGAVTGPAMLAREDLERSYGTDPGDHDRVRDVLGRYGLEVTAADPGSRRVKVAGTVAAMSRAFGTSLRRVSSPHPSGRGRVVHRYREGGLHLPAELDGIVTAVLGLDDRPQARPHFRRASAPAAATSYTPPQVARAYQFPAGTDGTGQVIAVIELGGAWRDRLRGMRRQRQQQRCLRGGAGMGSLLGARHPRGQCPAGQAGGLSPADPGDEPWNPADPGDGPRDFPGSRCGARRQRRAGGHPRTPAHPGRRPAAGGRHRRTGGCTPGASYGSVRHTPSDPISTHIPLPRPGDGGAGLGNGDGSPAAAAGLGTGDGAGGEACGAGADDRPVSTGAVPEPACPAEAVPEPACPPAGAGGATLPAFSTRRAVRPPETLAAPGLPAFWLPAGRDEPEAPGEPWGGSASRAP